MLKALKAFWRILTESDEDQSWFPHMDGKRMRRWNFQRHEYEFRPKRESGSCSSFTAARPE